MTKGSKRYSVSVQCSVCMCVCSHTCVFMYMYVCVCTHVYVCLSVCIPHHVCEGGDNFRCELHLYLASGRVSGSQHTPGSVVFAVCCGIAPAPRVFVSQQWNADLRRSLGNAGVFALMGMF